MPPVQIRLIAGITAICLFGERIPIHPLVGWFYERYSYKTGLTIAVVLAGLTTASYGLLHSFWLLFLMRCLWGIAWALFKQAGQLAVVDALQGEPTASGKLNGTFNGIVGIGGLVGMLGGGILVQHVNIELVTSIFGLCAFSSLILLRRNTFNIPTAFHVDTNSKGKARHNLIHNLALTVLLLESFILACVFMGIFKSSLSYWIDLLDIDNAIITNLLGVAGLAGLIQAIRMVAEPFLAPWIGNYKLHDPIGINLFRDFSCLVTSVRLLDH